MADRTYKATRPDGTDFRTGTIDYAAALGTGKPVTWRPGSPGWEDAKRMTKDMPQTYLSVSTEPGEVLTGGRWPCRLFAVQPQGEVIGHSEYPWKRCCRSLLVVEELPAHRALGPNGEAVAALVERAGKLTSGEIRELDAAMTAARDAAGAAARDAAWDAARAAARDAAWDAARAAARAAAWDAAWAAAGLVVRDLITPEQFALLHGSWAQVMDEAEVH